MSTFPVIKLSGDRAARGWAYGRQLADRIHRTFAFYNDVVFKSAALPEAEFERRSRSLMALTRGVFPALVEEIEIIAKSAEIDPWRVFLLNARTEVLNASVGECTSLAVPETRIGLSEALPPSIMVPRAGSMMATSGGVASTCT